MSKVLSPAQLQAVVQGIRDAEAAKQICRDGLECGMDLQGEYATLDAIQQRLLKVQEKFAPKRISEA